MAALTSFLVGGCLSVGLAVWALARRGSDENLQVSAILAAAPEIDEILALQASTRVLRK